MQRVPAHRWKELEPLVDRVLDTPAAGRDVALDAVSAGDPALREEVARLVAECEREHRLLDRPAPERFAALFDETAPPAPPPSLAERYRISSVIGRGGMATVYLGSDLRHGREVAVKVLRPVLAGPAGHARFVREIRIAARLRHPNIVPVYDSGEADAVLYYVMPYETGHSLRERLEREGTLPVEDVVVIVGDLCEALGHAHAHGIAHLDLKPDNVLLAGRHAMLADFGVARALNAAAGGEGAATPAPTAFGTPAYMAPEQGIPGAAVDHRADLYALGIVAWELLVGRTPFTADSAARMLEAHRGTVPPSLSALRPDLPAALVAVVDRCLAKDPGARWQTAEAVLERLRGADRAGAAAAAPDDRAARARRRVTRIALGAGAVAVAAWWLVASAASPRGRPSGLTPPVPATSRQLFLVADIENRTADPHVGTLVTELLRRNLAGTGALAHVSRSDVVATLRLMRRDTASALDAAIVRDMAERLDVPMIVEGSVWRAGPALVLSAQVTETGSGTVTHGAHAIARDTSELAAAVDSLVRGLGAGMTEPMEAPRTRFIRSATTSSPAALEQLRLGVDQRRLGNFLGAVRHHAAATRLDTAFASAWIAVTANRHLAGLPTLAVVPGLDRALARRDSLFSTEGMLVEWFHALHVRGDERTAVALMQRYMQELLRLRGREQGFTNDAAIVIARVEGPRAAELALRRIDAAFGWSPVSHQMAFVPLLHAQGKVREAEAQVEQILAEVPEHSAALRWLAALRADERRYADAHELASRIPRHNTLLNDLRVQGEMDAIRGRLDEARRHWEELSEQALMLDEAGAATELAAGASLLRLARGDTAAARADLAAFERRAGVDALPAHLRSDPVLAHAWARLGDVPRALDRLARYERELPPAWRGPDAGLLHRARAAIATARGEHRIALGELRAATRASRARTALLDEPALPLDAHPELARAWDAVGGADSAVAVYERYFAVRALGRTVVDAFERGAAHAHLAELLARRGDRAGAEAQLALLEALWRDADAPLRARVARARALARR